MRRSAPWALLAALVSLLFASCSIQSLTGVLPTATPTTGVGAPTTGTGTPTATSGTGTGTPTATGVAGTGTGTPIPCGPSLRLAPAAGPGDYTPADLQTAYDFTPLINKGDTGQGQTVVVIESFGSPTAQADLNAFSDAYGLPHTTVTTIAPLGPNPASNPDISSWAGETSLDIEVIHAVAPAAQIVILQSPVDETEGTIGLPQFRQLLEYAQSHHLGNVISNSWGASEVTLLDAASQTEIQQWSGLLQTMAQSGVTFLASSGDNGATDYCDLNAQYLSPVATTSFLTDDPNVTSVGGTSLVIGATPQETAWNGSGGGFSRFFAEPAYQKALPAAVQTQLQGRRGVPDVASVADPATGLRILVDGQWMSGFGGTSAAAPLWAGLAAIADQVAGKPLGLLNTRLYQIALGNRYSADFHDITAGNNSQGAVQGYNAVAGWDPVTGLGTPDAANLIPDLASGA